MPAREPPGRRAARPSEFRPRDWWAILGRVWESTWRDNLSIIAAGIAFYAMLALIPTIAALVAIYGLVADPADIQEQLASLRSFVPRDAYGIIEGQVSRLVAADSRALGLASLFATLLAFWSSRAGVAAMIQGLNVAYGERETRSILELLALSFGLTLLVLVIGALAIAAVVVLPAVLGILQLGALGEWSVRLLRWPILFGALVFSIGALYRYGPDRNTARVPWVTWGAVLAATLWVIASVLFSYYVSNFADYNKTYGSLGAIICLLFWFFISAFVVLGGAELNAQMELHTQRDTTVGPEKPMGERGAYVADHVS
jgi:membrane protein